MATHCFTIRLTSDAEPGTGLGGEVINDLVPRDHCRRPVVEASHLKGLMKAEFHAMSAHLGWDQSVETRIFGGHGYRPTPPGSACKRRST